MLKEILYCSLGRDIDARLLIDLALRVESANTQDEVLDKQSVEAGLINEYGEIEELGYDILSTLHAGVQPKRFEEFWATIPYSDEHWLYPKTRVLRKDKQLIAKWYEIAIHSVSEEELIGALSRYIEVLKRNQKSNDLTYMPPIYKFLMNGVYKHYLTTKLENVLL